MEVVRRVKGGGRCWREGQCQGAEAFEDKTATNSVLQKTASSLFLPKLNSTEAQWDERGKCFTVNWSWGLTPAIRP